jgi:probable rRNA maturation factor
MAYDVIITDNNSIAAINEQYRNIAKPTDVLSFPMIDYETAGDFSIIDQLPEEECFHCMLQDPVQSCR